MQNCFSLENVTIKIARKIATAVTDNKISYSQFFHSDLKEYFVSNYLKIILLFYTFIGQMRITESERTEILTICSGNKDLGQISI